MIVVRPTHPPLAVHDAMGLATDAELAAVAAVGSAAIPLAQRGAANGVATLGSDAKIPGSQLPALAIGETFTVASQAAMLALVAQRGDIAVRTDLTPSGFFLLTTDSPSTLADWVQITAPGSVVSVNTRTGAVTGLAEQSAVDAEAIARTAADTTLTTNVAANAAALSGLGTMSTQAASSVAITGGTVAGIADLTVADGGTGASTADAARTNLVALGIVETVNTVAASGAAQIIPDVTTATLSRITLTANCTFTFPAAAAGKSFTVVLVQDGTGSRIVTWPAAVKWRGAIAPTLSTGANKIDYLSFVCTDGTNWAGFVSGLDIR